MKIHSIEIKNLNSLYGTHTVDLSRDLFDAPIFLIVGPTGSGKSTILDAIFLALFGQTPRLSRQKGRHETDARMIMSQGTGTCRAAVVFSKLCPDGTRAHYRAIWSCKRARNKPRGRFQDPERSLEHLDPDGSVREILVSDKRQKYLEGPFSEVLEGLTVEDFQRSMILAQGEFAAFLKADERDRASILERLTDTVIYKRIGQRAAAHMRTCRDTLNGLEAEAQRLDLLPTDEVAQLREQCEALRQHEAEQTAECRRIEAAVVWAEREQSLHHQTSRALKERDDALHAREVCNSDRQRLERDRLLRPAAQLLEQIRQLEAHIQRRQHERDERLDAIRRLTIERPRAAHEVMQAQDRLEDCTHMMQRIRPILQQARLDTRALERAKREHQAAQAAAQATATKVRSAKERLEAHTVAVSSAQQALETSRHQLDALLAAEPLVHALPELQARYTQITRDREAWTQRSSKRDQQQARCAELKAQATALREELASAGEAEAPLQEALHTAQNTLAALQGDAADPQARRAGLERQRRMLQDQEVALEKAHQRSEAFAEVKQHQLELGQQVDELEMSLMAISSQLATEEMRYGELSDAVERELRHMEDVRAALAMAEQRRSLTSGEPCPLCGGTDHPYAATTEAQTFEARFEARRVELDDRIAQLEIERGTLGDRMNMLRTERTRTETTLSERQQQLQALKPRRIALMEQLAAYLATAGLPTAVRPEAIEAARHDAQHQRQTLVVQIERLGQAEDDQRRAERALVERRQATQAQHTELRTLEVRLDEAHAARHQTEVELQAQQSALDQALDDLMEQLRSHGLDSTIDAEEDGLTGVGRALGEGHQLKTRLDEANQARELARGDLQLAAAQQAQYRALWEQAEVGLKEAQDANSARQEEVDTLRQRLANSEAQVGALVEAGGPLPPPDRLERQMEAKVEQARTHLDTVQRHVDTLQRELDLHTLVVKERQQQLEADAHTLTAQRQQLRDLWAGMDLEDDLEQMLDQALLTDAERERLTEMLEALDRSAHTAVARVDLTQRALQDHQENRPEGLNLETFALEHERLALGTLREELEATMREALRIQGIIERQEERARTLTALQQRLDRARQDHAIAYEIHKLIGVNDGDSFRQYAQILNLQELIDRANVRLRWLNPRYALVTGLDKDEQPRLGFAVRDSHYAQVERPLTTLSGGETFIVSLALALGLADFRTIDMPIETLLLDEGLGTLDSEVLNTVMGALERLHGGGTQIGIISHVEALKERVEARIVLEKQGGGRSWLRFEMGDGT